MSDTIDREELQDTQDQPAAQDAPQAEGAQEQPIGQEPEKQEPVVTAVQFPSIGPEDLPQQPEQAPGAIPDIPLEDDELPMLEEDTEESKGKLYNFVAQMDDKQFRRAQAIFGIVMGALAALALIIPIPGEENGTSLWSFVIALVIMVWIPRFVERKIEKRMPVAQRWMLIVFVIGRRPPRPAPPTRPRSRPRRKRRSRPDLSRHNALTRRAGGVAHTNSRSYQRK